MADEPGPPDLRDRGLPGGATVVMVVPVHERRPAPVAAGWRRVEVSCIVEPPAGPRYDVVQRLALPVPLADRLDGCTFPCWIDPLDRTRVLLDLPTDG